MTVPLLGEAPSGYVGPQVYGSIRPRRIEQVSIRDRVAETAKPGPDADVPDADVPANDDDLLFSQSHTTDYYELLGLGTVRHRASAADIRRAYKRASLMFHPDKSDHPNAMQRFKAITKAYEILSTPDKRLAFDSTDDVNDDIPPAGLINDDSFYGVLRPVFARNARWSVDRAVPDLGHAKTPIEEVLEFYSFWETFRTWRNFEADCQYDLDQAANRDERRWMTQQNRREQKAKVKAERERIAKLTDLAKTHDPRIRAHQEQRAAEKKAAEEAKERQAEAEKAATERRAKKRAMIAERNAVDRERRYKATISRLRASGSSAELDYLLKTAQPTDLEALEVMAGDASALATRLEEVGQVMAANRAAFEKKARGSAAVTWSEEQEMKLATGIKKFGEHMPGRWARISEMTGMAEKECIKRSKQLGHRGLSALRKKAAGTAQKSVVSAPVDEGPTKDDGGWTKKEQKAFEKGLRMYPEARCREDGIDPGLRWELIAGFVPGKEPDDCKARFVWCREQVRTKK